MAAIFKASGLTAQVTTTDTAIELVAAVPDAEVTGVCVMNEGPVAGFFSIDGGTEWARLPAGGSPTLDRCLLINTAVLVKRVAGGANLSGLWGFVWAGRM